MLLYVNLSRRDSTRTFSSTCGLFRFSGTNPPVVYGYPLYSANVSNISIVWNINKENNNCFLKNVVTVCNCTARNGTGYDCVNGTSRVDVKSRNATIITVTSVVIGLSPFTSYVCSAFTVSSGGASNESDLVHAITAQDGKQAYSV